MNFLITGATGFVGRQLVDLLLTAGHSVNYLGRNRSTALDSRAAFFHWDTKEEPPLDCICRPDAIIHLAGEPIAQRWDAEIKRRIYGTRVQGTRNLVTAIGKLKYKPAILVSGSAIGYYGERGDEPLTEESAPGCGFMADLCVNWEKEAMRARSFGVRVVPIRIGIVLGSGGGALPRMAVPFRFGLGGRLGSGRQWMSWIHVKDLTGLLLFAAVESHFEGPVNGCSPQPVSNGDFTRELGRVLHRPALFPVPRFALRLAMGELAEHIFDSVRVIPRAALQSGFEFEFPALNEALKSALRLPG